MVDALRLERSIERCGGSSPSTRTKVNAPVAQLVEHLIEDQGVGGSIPSGGTKFG